jgi:metal-responsive CopG/Arc/MetJ family transcriptional regulator
MKAATISVSIPENLLKQLNKICDLHERTKSYLVKKALEKYLKESFQEDLQLINRQEAAFISSSSQVFAEEWQGKEDEKAFVHLQKYSKTK